RAAPARPPGRSFGRQGGCPVGTLCLPRRRSRSADRGSPGNQGQEALFPACPAALGRPGTGKTAQIAPDPRRKFRLGHARPARNGRLRSDSMKVRALIGRIAAVVVVLALAGGGVYLFMTQPAKAPVAAQVPPPPQVGVAELKAADVPL